MNMQENQWSNKLMNIFDIKDITDKKNEDHLGKENMCLGWCSY